MLPVYLIITSGIFSFLVTYVVIRYAAKFNLFQEVNHRSSHIKPTPGGGGIGFVIASSITYLSANLPLNLEISSFIILALILSVLGYVDDKKHLPVRVRFITQFLVLACGIYFIGSLPEFRLFIIDFSGIALSLLAMILGLWWLNLFNFMDGTDGIAASQALIMLVLALLLGWYQHDGFASTSIFLWMLIICGALVGFLLLNFPPAKIFMGDTGSLWLGFVLFSTALLTIKDGWLAYEPWIIMGALFVTDATVTLMIRMIKRESWREGHRDHAYQRLSRYWGGHLPVLLFVIAVNLFWLAPLAWLTIQLPDISGVIAFISYIPIILGCIWVSTGRISQY